MLIFITNKKALIIKIRIFMHEYVDVYIYIQYFLLKDHKN
jgi:hypothetical protein